MKLEFFRQISEKILKYKIFDNPSSGCPVVPCRRADGHTDTRKLIVAFRSFANSLKNDEETEFSRIVTHFSSILKININAEASKPSISVRTNAKVIIVQ
jgi:hypothetical protein